MNFLIKQIEKSNRKLKQNSIDKYIAIIKKIAIGVTGEEFKNLSFLKDFNKVMEFIRTKNTFNYLKCILVVLSINKQYTPGLKPKPIIRRGFKRVYKKYINELQLINSKEIKRISTHKKNKKERDNWVSWSEISKAVEGEYKIFHSKFFLKDGTLKPELKDENNLLKVNQFNINDLNEIKKLFILSLYTEFEPRRLEYCDTRHITYTNFTNISDEIKDNNIFLVELDKNNMFFSFGKNVIKVKTVINEQLILNKRLLKIASIFLDINYHLRKLDDHLFFKKTDGKKMSKVNLSMFLTSYFKSKFNKNISVCMLRKIKNSERWVFEENNRREIAKKMNHSVHTNQRIYTKYI